jgi:hypothetical protein
MPLVGCPRHGPPVLLAGRGRRPSPAHATAPKYDASPLPLLLTRRAVSTASLFLAALPIPALLPQLTPVATASEAESEVQGGGQGAEEMELERYSDQEQGFTLLKPASWPKVRSAWNNLSAAF